MRRWLAVYAAAFFAFLHLPLLTLAAFSFNLVALHGVGALLARLVPRGVSRSADYRWSVEQRDHCVVGDGDFDCNWNGLRVWPVEAGIAFSDGRALSIVGDARDRHRDFAARSVSVDVPLAALAAGALHGGAGARGVLDTLRGDCGLGAAANHRPHARRGGDGPWGRTSGRRSGR